LQLTKEVFCITFIVAPCILKSILFTHQQMHCLLNLETFKTYKSSETCRSSMFCKF
jgi:hypothetical protein